jgi:hypothetical protein
MVRALALALILAAPALAADDRLVDGFEDDAAATRWSLAAWADAGLDESGAVMAVAPTASGATEGEAALAVPLRFAGQGYAQAFVSRETSEDLGAAAAVAIDVTVPPDAPALGAKIILTLGPGYAWTEPNTAQPLAPGATTTVRLDLAGAVDPPVDPALFADVRGIGLKVDASGATWRGAISIDNLRALALVPPGPEDVAVEPVGTFGGFVKKDGTTDIPARNGLVAFVAAPDAARIALVWPELDASGGDFVIGAAPLGGPATARFRDWTTLELDAPGGSAILSRTVPAARFRTDATAFSWQSGDGAGRAPAARAAFVLDGAVQVADLRASGPIDLSRMSEPWMLVWAGPAGGWPFDVPVLLAFEHRPLGAAPAADGLGFSFSGPAGAVNVLPIYGIVRPAVADTSAWDNGLPADVLVRCRRALRWLAAFPISCTEHATIDEGAGTVAVTDEYAYDEITDDWGTAPLELAPVPPVIARAAANGYPASFAAPLADEGVATFFGPFMTEPGPRAAFTLPLPAGVARLPVAVRTTGSPAAEAAHGELVQLVAQSTPAGPADFYLDNDDRAVAFLAEAWPALGLAERARALVYAPHALEHGLLDASLQALVEPVTGQTYLNSAKYWASTEAFDKEWYNGRQLAAAALYAENVDPLLVRRLWPRIRGLYRYDRIFWDWATGSALSSCYGLTELADGMHFAWEGTLGSARLARLFGDRATFEDACWHAARQQAALYGAWFQADWAKSCDYAIGHISGKRIAAQDAETRFAIDGYTEEFGCATLELRSFWETTNFLFFDCVPQLAFYRDLGLAPRVHALEYDVMPALHPSWKDGNTMSAVDGRYYGEEYAMAHVMARALLFGEPAASLLPIYDGTAGTKAAAQWYTGRRYGIAGPTLLAIERADAPAIEAPCGMAAVTAVSYDAAAKRARVEMRGRADGVGVLRIEARRGMPRAVRIDGGAVSATGDGPFAAIAVPLASGAATVVEADFD